MNRTLLLTSIAAVALSACNKSSHTIVAGSPDDNVTVNTANVVLPPAIEASKSYRCKDNTVVYIDWLNDKMNADIRASKEGSATRVTATEAGGKMAATGYSLTGTKDAGTVTVERPGKASQTCKA